MFLKTAKNNEIKTNVCYVLATTRKNQTKKNRANGRKKKQSNHFHTQKVSQKNVKKNNISSTKKAEHVENYSYFCVSYII